MKPKKILVVSMTPTHPPNAGNRIRILEMSRWLMKQGHEVHFLYSDQGWGDDEEMKAFWRERFHPVRYEKPKPGIMDAVLKKVKKTLNRNYRYYSGVDDHYNLGLDAAIGKLKESHRFDAVLVEYIFLTKAFRHFDGSTLKVIDTHDVMTDRHMLFLKEGKAPNWYSTTMAQERKGILRSDVVIAIQDREKGHFESLAPGKRVVSVGHIVPLKEPLNAHPRKKLLFFGSNNSSNHFGIADFLENVFPGLKARFPGIELIIAGNICDKITDGHDGVSRMGELKDLEKVYELSDIVLNPLTVGTGLKIKMIEAMGFSKAVISTEVGAEGIEGEGSAYLLARSMEDYADHLGRLLGDGDLYARVCANAMRQAESYNRRNSDRLAEIFNN